MELKYKHKINKYSTTTAYIIHVISVTLKVGASSPASARFFSRHVGVQSCTIHLDLYTDVSDIPDVLLLNTCTSTSIIIDNAHEAITKTGAQISNINGNAQNTTS